MKSLPVRPEVLKATFVGVEDGPVAPRPTILQKSIVLLSLGVLAAHMVRVSLYLAGVI